MSEATPTAAPESMDVHEVLKCLPHRYPFLMIDRVTEVVAGSHISALKNVTINEPFFPGHYPHHPVMPGVLIVEAMAQAAAILSFKTLGDQANDNSVYYFVGIDEARFKRPVTAGDQLVLEAKLEMSRRGLWKFVCCAKVDGQVAAEAKIMCTMRMLDE